MNLTLELYTDSCKDLVVPKRNENRNCKIFCFYDFIKSVNKLIRRTREDDIAAKYKLVELKTLMTKYHLLLGEQLEECKLLLKAVPEYDIESEFEALTINPYVKSFRSLNIYTYQTALLVNLFDELLLQRIIVRKFHLISNKEFFKDGSRSKLRHLFQTAHELTLNK